MAISLQVKLQAVQLLASLENVAMNPSFLAEDINALAQVWDHENEFMSAVNNTYQALSQLVSRSVDTASLLYKLEGWNAFHFQHTRAQGQPADMRVVFKEDEDRLIVLAFGHRDLPNSVYFTATNRT